MEGLSILFVLIGQFLGAIVVLFDKHIVKSVSRPIVYTFYGSMLSGVVLVLVPFGIISIPAPLIIGLSLVAAAAYVLSVFFLYDSLKISAPSEVMPVVGAVSAISSFCFSYVILGTLLPHYFIVGFILLIAGMLLISHFELTRRSFFFLVLSGLFFGISTVLVKKIFMYDDSFANGFFWSRMANVVAALFLLLWPGNFQAIKKDLRHGGVKGKFIILNTKILAGLGFLAILIAINFGDVALVNALASLQYVFLMIFAFIFTDQMRDYFSERRHPHEMRRKLFATLLIVVGFVVLFTK